MKKIWKTNLILQSKSKYWKTYFHQNLSNIIVLLRILRKGENLKEEDEAFEKISSLLTIESPNTNWNDIVGLDHAKTVLKHTLIDSKKYACLMPQKPCSNILFYGPPGCGKSFLARAVAGELKDHSFVTVDVADLHSKYLGESEKLMKSLFAYLRTIKPCIVFLGNYCFSKNFLIFFT